MRLRHIVSHSVSRTRITCTLFALFAVAALPVFGRAAQQGGATSPAVTGKRIWLRDAQTVEVNHAGSVRSVQGLASARPLALAEGDFDADGVEDVVVGYASGNGGILALHRGKLDAFAPQSESSFHAIGRGEFPSPFIPTASLFDLPVRPDFVQVGSFNGNGYPDVVIAARGDDSIYLLTNDGKGNFAAPKAIKVGGPITTLAAGDFGPHQIYSKLLVGIADGSGSYLSVYSGSQNSIGGLDVLRLHAAASNIVFGNFGGAGSDAVFISGGNVVILHSSSMRLETLTLPVRASSLALGSFIWDRNVQRQIAILSSDGSVHIAAHSEFDPRAYTSEELQVIAHSKRGRQGSSLARPQVTPINGWKIVESFHGVANSGKAVLLRTRITDHGSDDVMVLDPSSQQLTVIAHPELQPGDVNFMPGEISSRPYNGSPIAAIAMRTNVDGRPGVVAIHQGEVAPSVMMPLPDPTFFPNRTDDPTPPTDLTTVCNNTSNTDTSSNCSLREAILKANSISGTDTVQLAAGTYTLSIPRQQVGSTVDYSGNHGALYVNDSLNVVGQVDGSGHPASIIQAGTSATNGVDMVMAVNEDINPLTNATASISNVIFQFGRNTGNTSTTQDGDGGCMEFDTGTSGNANLNLTNVILQHCSTTNNNGAGIALFNFIVPGGTGTATFSNTIIQNNAAAPGEGAGGIFNSTTGNIEARMVLTNSKVLNNQAPASGAIGGVGAGIFMFGPDGGSLPAIHNTTISGNQSSGEGGGIWSTGGFLIDQGSVISNNSAGTANLTNNMDGGGMWLNISPDTVTISKATITGNSATGDGGGIRVDDAGGRVNISFSRIVGNTAGGVGSDLSNRTDITPDSGTIVTATNDWWGTNNPSTVIDPSKSTCPAGPRQVCFDPWIVLTHTANPQKIRINQSTTLTADMSKDNHGNGAALSGNLDEIVGLPITFDNPNLGTIPQAQPETLGNPVPTATATFNAGGAGGLGSANATVDEAVVAANSNLIASASESGTTATITTVGAHGFSTGEFVQITGVGVSGYNSASGKFFSVTSTPTANTFTYTANTAGLGASSGGAVNGGILILQPPSITKSFAPTTVAINAPSTLSFSVDNGNVIPIDASFTDGLPANLVVATTPNVVNGCGGSVTATAGGTSISFSNSDLATGTCTISVDVQSAVDNTYNNSVAIDSTAAGNGNTSSATLIVISPPSITKAFGAASVAMNGTTSLTFTISNPNVNTTLTGLAFTDSLPAGLVAATPNGLSTTCNGTAAATAGSSSVTLSGSSLAASASCTVSVNVQGTTAGVKNNSVQVSSTNGGTGNTSNASLTVVGPPRITKAFGAASIPLNGSTSLSFAIQNANGVALTGVGFTDTLPSGLVVATPNGLTGSCGGGTITSTQGSGTISLSGATLVANTSCTFSVNVTGTAAGVENNTTSAVSSTEGGTGGTASASITVIAPPSIAKAFNPSAIAVSGTTSLTFTITNPSANTVALTGVAFSDTLPTGLTVASSTATVCGGTLTTTAPTGITLTGASVAAGTPCQFSVTVTGGTSGQFTNTTGAVTSINGGTGNTASANLEVASPPSIKKAFGAASVPLNGTTSLTFTISNPNSGLSLTGVTFTDSLPAGLAVATPNGLSSTCGGTATGTAGSGVVSLTDASLAASASCTVSVNIQGTTAGVKNNSVQVSSTNGGAGNTSNASLTVVGPPTITKAFGAASIPLNVSTTLSFTIQNANGVSLTGVGFTDTLPSGLVVATPNGLSGSCGGGTISATAGGGTISLSGATLDGSASCSFTANVTGATAGTKNNTTSAVTSTEGGTGGTASASITVIAPPSIAKAFNPSAIAVNGTTSLTFTITNPSANTAALTGVAFADTLPTGLTVASSTATVCGGTLTTTAPTGIALIGASVAAGTPCQFSVTVTGGTFGQYTNTTGAVTSTNGGTGNTASANLEVASPPSITKAFGAASVPLNGTTSLTFTISNPNSGLSLTGVGFTDSFPAGLVVASTPNLNNSCGGTATASGGSASLSGATVSGTCTISVNVQGTTAGVKNNSVQVSSTNAGAGNTSNASLTVVGPPTITKGFGAASIPLNGSTSLAFTIQNGNSVALTGVGFSDTLPSGLVVATPNGLTGSCGAGTIGAIAGGGTISLSAGTLGGSASCTFAVNVTGTTAGTKNNTTSIVTSNEGGTGGTASASITVVAPPSISKAFGASTVSVNGTTSLTLTITNPNPTVALSGVGVTDNFPSGLEVAATPAATNGCGGVLTAVPLSGSISLSSGTIAAGASCIINLSVTVTAPGVILNTTGSVTSTNGGTGNSGSASLQAGDFTISATPASESIGVGATASYKLTVSSNSGFQGAIQLACSGGPAKSACTISPSHLTLSSGSEMARVTINVSVPKSASKGTFTLRFTATSGSLTHSTNVQLILK